MQITEEELKQLQRAGLSLEEGFYLWALAKGSSLPIAITADQARKLTSLGFLSSGNLSRQGAEFIASLEGNELPEAERFEEFYEVFPIDNSNPPLYVPANPRPIRVKRALALVEYRVLLGKGFREEELIRAAKNYKSYLIRTCKDGRPFEFMSNPYNFLVKQKFMNFLKSDKPTYAEIIYNKKNAAHSAKNYLNERVD